MSDKGKAQLIPKRRFPEFLGAAPWKLTSLGDASTPVIERVGERKLTPVSISAGIGFVPQAEKFGRDISGNQYQLYTLVRDGDFVYNKGNSLKFPEGCVYLLRGWEQVAAPNVFICFRLKDGYSNGFFQNCFEANAHGKQLKRHITSGARSNGLLNISKDAFFGVKIPTPTWPEQQKIADCLSSLDELIATQARKVDALKIHKKGLMQQLFPREGETQPRLRFPEFRDAGEWDEKRLSTIAELTSSKRVHLSDYVPNGIPFFRGKEISLLKNNQIPEDVLFISEEHYEEIRRKYGAPEIGDILITAVGTLGNVYCIQNLNKFYFKDGNLIWMKNISEDSVFLEILLNVESKKILSSAIGSSQKALTMVELNKLKFAFPNKEEQQRIADCFASLDTLITAATQELKALKTHKNGLMQQLFPSAEAVEA